MAFTSWATRGSCSTGPMGPQMPTGLSAVVCRQESMYSIASARKNSSRESNMRT